MGEELKLKVHSLLRKSGLAQVNKAALCCLLVLALLIIAFALWRFWPKGQQESFSIDSSAETISAQSDSSTDQTQAIGEVAVDVEGAVNNPGLYRLSADLRAGDAIEAAGGLRQDASAAAINKAKKLEDGMQIYVPTQDESNNAASAGSSESNSTSSGASSAAGSSASSGVDAQGKVNINTATSEQLQTLQGVGPSIASKIIDYREKNGAFKKIEDIKNVSGIGDSRFAAIESSITV